MPPGTEEVELTKQQVALLVSTYERLDILDTHIALTDAVPRVSPK